MQERKNRKEEGGRKKNELELGVESARSYNIFGNPSSNDHLRLRVSRVDGFNSALEVSPERGGVSLGTVLSLHHVAINLLWTVAIPS